MEERRAGGLGLWALAGAAGLSAALALRFWVPAEGRESSICLLRRWTGIPCPTCGMTRAFAHLAKGEWAGVLAAHPLAPLLALELAVLWLLWGARLRGRPLTAGGALSGDAPAGDVSSGAPDWLLPLLIGNLAVLVAFWLGRAATGTLPW